jgi:hypothetical protein
VIFGIGFCLDLLFSFFFWVCWGVIVGDSHSQLMGMMMSFR